MSKLAVFDIVKDDMADLEQAMLAAVASPVDLVTAIGEHLIKAGGKRLRPALYFITARGNAAKERYLPLAVALEMIHMATLVHDDVVDNSALRRGVVTANAKWDNKSAVLSGDYLFARAFSLVARHDYGSKVIGILSEIICDLSEGEILQNQRAFICPAGEAEYYERIAKKTANFIAASCELGALVAGLHERDQRLLWEYGQAIGMAFQITDDILDITGTERQLGKPVGNDLLQGIITLPVIRALATGAAAERLRRLATDRGVTEREVADCIGIVRATDAIEYSYAKVDEYLQAARQAVPASLPLESRRAYLAIADFIALRHC